MLEAQQILAFLLSDHERLNDLKNRSVTSLTFTKEAHKKVFQMLRIFIEKYKRSPSRADFDNFIAHVDTDKKYREDILTEYDKISQEDIGGIDFKFLLDDFINKVIETQYSKYLQEAMMKSQSGFLKVSMEELKLKLFELDKLRHNDQSMVEIKETIEKLRVTKGELDMAMGVRSGIEELDQLTWGWKPGDLVLIMAATGDGKSTSLLNFAYNAYINDNKNVLFIQLETGHELLFNRMHALALESNANDIKFGRLSDKQKELFMEVLDEWDNKKNAMNVVDFKYSCTPDNIESKIHEIQAVQDIDLVIVDYLGILSLNKGDSLGKDYLNKGLIAERLKSIARNYNVPIVTAQQVTRDAMKSKKKEHYDLHDIGTSIYITHHCDIVMSIKTKDNEEAQYDNVVEAIINVVKNRQGEKGEVPVNIDFAAMKIEGEGISLT